jgi:glycosyltransferase involved in cell wall biosynthesis
MAESLIQAVIEVNKVSTLEPVHLLIVGEGPLRQSLQDLSAPYPFIHFLGFKNQQEMPLMYRMADTFVLPSHTETWGLAVNEAFACSRAAIVSDRVGCAPDLVKHGETGYVFKCGDYLELAKLIAGLKNDGPLCETMGINDKKLIDNWSIEKAASAMLACIKAKTQEYKQ